MKPLQYDSPSRHALRHGAAALAILVCLSVPTPPLRAAEAMVRVACDKADEGAEVIINGIFRGDCPVDSVVPPGTIKLRAVKKVDARMERVFEQEFRLGDGGIKRIEVALSQPRLNPEAQKQAEASLAQLLKQAEAGDALSMNRMGEAYFFGNSGVPNNDAQAVQWFRKAAEAGLPQGMGNYSYMLSTGRGIEKDLTASFQWAEKAAQAGDAFGMARLAFSYLTGQGTTRNEAEAVNWYLKSAEKGNAQAMFNLAGLYLRGQGTAKDQAEAINWYRKSLAAGNAAAAEELKKLGAN